MLRVEPSRLPGVMVQKPLATGPKLRARASERPGLQGDAMRAVCTSRLPGGDTVLALPIWEDTNMEEALGGDSVFRCKHMDPGTTCVLPRQVRPGSELVDMSSAFLSKRPHVKRLALVSALGPAAGVVLARGSDNLSPLSAASRWLSSFSASCTQLSTLSKRRNMSSLGFGKVFSEDDSFRSPTRLAGGLQSASSWTCIACSWVENFSSSWQTCCRPVLSACSA
mmetsp:Transcript_48988/g.116539  ORF Transcript_48988/g.116539 Transcript_48988/m.116539 type:complete len:224 (+) Transcript_48988:173-844(+)